MGKSTEDYPLGALGGAARGFGLGSIRTEGQPAALSRKAHCPPPVVISCS